MIHYTLNFEQHLFYFAGGNMNIFRLYSLLIVVMFLVSCQSPNQMSTTEVAPSPSVNPIGEQYPTSTIPVIVTPTVSIQLPPENVLEYECLDITTNIPEDAILTGKLMLSGKQPYYYDFGDRRLHAIPDNRGDFAVSPDGKWLAYYEISNDSPTGMWLTVENAEGQKKRLPLQKEWFWGAGLKWLDDQRLVYNVLDRNKPIPALYPVAVINPFSGEVQEIASDYPGYPPPWGMEGTLDFFYSSVVYDPTLDLVVYPEVSADGVFVTLWDRHSQKAIAKLEELGIFYHYPLWLPDENQFVVPVIHQGLVNEWFSINRTGEIHQLTHFGDYFTQADIELASISPNGRYLAFWMSVSPSKYTDYNLAVLDFETQQVINYCIPGSSEKFAGEPVWSPDSRYIALMDFFDKETSDSHVILVDPFEGWATRFVENLTPHGWMATSP